MKGLVKKDLLSFYYRQSKLSLVFMVFIYAFCILKLRNGYGLYSTVLLSFPMMASGLAVNLCEMDGKCNFDKYAISLPFSKAELVQGRYLCFLVCSAGAFLLMIALTIAYYFLHNAFSMQMHILILLYGIALLILFGGICIASAYLFGINGSSITMLAVMGIFLGTFLCISFLDIDISFLWTMNPFLVWAVFFLFSLIVCYGCYHVSVRTYVRQHQ